MKVQNFSFSVTTKGYNDIVDISANVLEQIKSSGVVNGNALVFCPGSTCGITTLEYESGCIADLKQYYEAVAPMKKEYKHNERWGDGNGFSHVRAAITKSNFIFPIINGAPALGAWQQIVLIDFDNHKRSRSIIVQIIGE